jgi:hypothetical protein
MVDHVLFILAYVVLVIAVFAATLSTAIPRRIFMPNGELRTIDLKRRDEYDAYGLNSILSRFHKRFKSSENSSDDDVPADASIFLE